MIRVEASFWPLVAVGAVPDAEADGGSATADERLWLRGDVRLAVVIPGDHSRAWLAEEEIFAWLDQRRDSLWRCVSRVAWIFEDEAMRRSAERWLTLTGDRLFRGDIRTFRSVRDATSWLSEPGS